jgi:DNA-binding transcriptional regulator YiaG
MKARELVLRWLKVGKMTADDLKAWRARLRLNKTEAAKALRVSVKAYRQWEQGLNPVPDSIGLTAAAVAMGLPPWGSKPSG